MPRGEKSSYTDKQKRQASHIEEGYEKKGVSKEGRREPGDRAKGAADAKRSPHHRDQPDAVLLRPSDRKEAVGTRDV